MFIPFVLQMAVIFLDEVVFHLKRDLPKWERIGHPLDTLTVIACFAFAIFIPFSTTSLWWYVALALFSTVFVTKDEFVHKEHCPAAEQWLHALLFVNHPIVLTCVGLMWPHLHGQEIFSFLPPTNQIITLITIQLIGAVGFFLYQVIYWNFVREHQQ